MSSHAIATVEPWHGTYGGYVRRRCRCDQCREYNNARARGYYARKLAGTPSTPQRKAQMAAASRRRVERGLPNPNDPRHGITGYRDYGCRCEPCREAMTAHRRNQKTQRNQENPC